MDLLSTVLKSIRVIDGFVAYFEARGAWAFRMATAEPRNVFIFCPQNLPIHLRVDGESPVTAQPGDAAVILGTCFTFASDAAAPPLPMQRLWQGRQLPELGQRLERFRVEHLRWNVDQSAPLRQLISISMQLEDVQRVPLFGMLPRCIVVPRDQHRRHDLFGQLMAFIDNESGRPTASNPGYEVVSLLVAQLTLFELMRSHVMHVGTETVGWMKGMSDPRIGQALVLIHGESERDWHLETLAQACHLSRSSFSRRFMQLVGQPPMDYVNTVRLRRAARRLAAGERVGAVADATGYQSEWAFRRAFAKQFGVAPSRYRRDASG